MSCRAYSLAQRVHYGYPLILAGLVGVHMVHRFGVPALRSSLHQRSINHFFRVSSGANVRYLESAHLVTVSRVTVLAKPVQLPIDDQRPATWPSGTQVSLDDRAERMFGPRPSEI